MNNKDMPAMFMVLNDIESDGSIQTEYLKNSQTFNIRIYESLIGEADIILSRFDAKKLAKALLTQIEGESDE